MTRGMVRVRQPAWAIAASKTAGRNRAFTFENLRTDFGARSAIARGVLGELWAHLHHCLDNPGVRTVKVLYQEWRHLFAQASKFGRQARLHKHFRTLGLDGQLDYSRVLFTLHTYHALLCKLLAAELVTTIHHQGCSGFAAETSGASPEALVDLLASRIEQGEIFKANHIDNFMERTFFSWYLEKAPRALMEAVRAWWSQLRSYHFAAAAQPPIRDVMKDFYQDLVPEALRKNIGEFYTPEWLVNYVLNRTGYQGTSVLAKRFLDPCCGSGNFLIHAIARCKHAAAQRNYTSQQTANYILKNVIGFDLNPLAVIAARVNYLLALSDLLPAGGRVEIPVYLVDAVSPAIGQANVIAGNPPWVRWSDLPSDYRRRIQPTCCQFGILSRTPFFGGNELDISGMIAYTVTDKWLADGGTLGFVITQVHFQAPSSEGFREFRLPNGCPLGLAEVDDFTEVRPFLGPVNKPAVFTWVRGQETIYPVTYRVWRKKGSARIPENASLEEALNLLDSTNLIAQAIPPDNRWSILAAHEVGLREKLSGGSGTAWRGRKGITTDLNRAFFVRLVGPGSGPGLVKIRTLPPNHKNEKTVPLFDADVDAALVYPLLKGSEQIRPFAFSPCEDLAVIVPNSVISSIPNEQKFRREYPATYKYFQRLNRTKDEHGTRLLESRSSWRGRLREMGAPFYAVYNVGPYTFSPYKVAWAEMGKVVAAVVSSQTLPHGLGRKVIVPDHKVYFVAARSKREAHFLCALLNAAPVNTFTNSFVVGIQIGGLFRHLRLPPFDPTDAVHTRLAELSQQAHASGLLTELHEEIDSLAWQVIQAESNESSGDRRLKH